MLCRFRLVIISASALPTRCSYSGAVPVPSLQGCKLRGTCKVRSMRPLAIVVDIASAQVAVSATLYYCIMMSYVGDERAALRPPSSLLLTQQQLTSFLQKELPARRPVAASNTRKLTRGRRKEFFRRYGCQKHEILKSKQRELSD